MKAIKKIVSLIFVAMLCLGIFSVASCGEEKPTAYTICVTDASGNAIEGVYIGICTYDEATGVFTTVPSRITVPAATVTQDPVTGAFTTVPGNVTLTVTGTV